MVFERMRMTATRRSGGPPRTARVARATPAHTAQVLPHRLATTPMTSVMQLARLNVRQKDGTISGVAFGNRPPSNLSKQGQHITAFVAFQDAVLSHVRDKTPAQAATALIGLMEMFKELPGMKSQPKHILEAMDKANTALEEAAKSDDVAKDVGEIIDTVLAIRNAIPLTAVSTHEGGGHGEAKTSGALEVLETAIRTGAKWKEEWGSESDVAAQAQYSMWRLLDFDPSSPASDDSKRDDKLEQMGRHVLGHFMSMRMAYPGTWYWLSTKKEYYLSTYLQKNRNVDGMPLQKLETADLEFVMKYALSFL
jgi:hypothetical protein